MFKDISAMEICVSQILIISVKHRNGEVGLEKSQGPDQESQEYNL